MKNEKLKQLLKNAPVFGGLRADLEQKKSVSTTADTDADDSDDALDMSLTAKEIAYYHDTRDLRAELQRRATTKLMKDARKVTCVELRALVDEVRAFENDAYRLDLLTRRLRGRHQERKESEIYARANEQLRALEEMQMKFKNDAAGAESMLHERMQAEERKRKEEKGIEAMWRDLEPAPIYSKTKKAVKVEELEDDWELEL